MYDASGRLFGKPRTTSADASVPGLWTMQQQIEAKRAGLWPPNAGEDPYFSNVSLLLRGDGTNGSTTIVDESFSPKTVTAYGNAQISTAQSKYGGSSIAFDGSGDYAQTSVSTDFLLGTSDFTIELWARRGQSAPANATFLQMGDGTSLYSMIFGFTSGSTLLVWISSNGSSWDIASAQTLGTPQVDTWVHYALTRNGSNFYAFQDGVQQSTWVSSLGIYQNTNQVTVGKSQNNASEDFKGHLDDLRITKGVARYTSNFTPPDAL